jgi:hypothetical protein
MATMDKLHHALINSVTLLPLQSRVNVSRHGIGVLLMASPLLLASLGRSLHNASQDYCEGKDWWGPRVSHIHQMLDSLAR